MLFGSFKTSKQDNMLRVLLLPDSQTGRFWRIETLESELMLNWGRVGSSGRYELKTFDSPASCEAEAERLTQAKLAAGYQEYHDFDPQLLYYYDDDDYGLHPLTSHPIFRQYFQPSIYYSSIQEGAPFGNDEGSDALWELSDLLRRRPHADLQHYPAQLMERLYHEPYYPPRWETIEELQALAKSRLGNRSAWDHLRRTDRLIIALALGQVKISGKLDLKLYHLAQKSLDRIKKLKELGAPVRCTMALLDEVREHLEYYALETGLISA